MNEEWKDIKGYEGYYQVSNLGRVRSCERMVNSRYGCTRVSPSIIKAQTDNGHGYLIVTLSANMKKKNFYVHRLVASLFVSGETETRNTVNHIDENKQNNVVDNLEWLSVLENVRYSRLKMCKPKSIFKTTTGYKYIKMRGDRYRLNIKGAIDRQYKTLEEALKMREVVLDDGKYYAERKEMFRVRNNL